MEMAIRRRNARKAKRSLIEVLISAIAAGGCAPAEQILLQRETRERVN